MRMVRSGFGFISKMVRLVTCSYLRRTVPPDDKIVWCSEENVEIIPLNNPVIMERFEIGLHMLHFNS